MKKKLFDLMIRQFRKPIYRIAMILLGLPTFVVSWIAYLAYRRHHSSHTEQFTQSALAMLKQEGELTRLRSECEGFIKRKYEFFGKDCSSKDYDREIEAQYRKALEETLERRRKALMAEAGVTETPPFMSYLTGKLNSSGLLVLSVVTSIPLYILMLICLNPFARYALERIVMMIFVIFGVVFVVFTILHSSSKDPAANVLGEYATQEQKDEFNRSYGLDKPYVVQLFTQFKRLITFDLGNSYSGNEDVFQSIMRKFPATLTLSVFAIIFGLVVSLPLGIISAIKPYTAWDYIAMFIAMILLSLPQFWFGMVMILGFSIKSGLLPATFDTGNPLTYIMPSIVMSAQLLAGVTRMTRSSMLEVKSQDYIVTARAKGLSNLTVILRHTLGNALIPIITVIGLQFGQILGGSAVPERVFSVKGIGSYIIDKQFLPDIPVLLAGVVYLAVIVSIVNLVIDLLYAVLDPRIKSDIKNR